MSCGKKCYKRAEANAVVNLAHSRRRKLASRGGRFRKRIPVRVYWCRECNAWHVTHYWKNPGNE